MASAYLVAVGLILHDVPEGFAMANAYIASPSLGVLIGLAIALHNLPKEFAMAVPAVTLRSRRFLFGAALLSTLAEPMGAIIGLVAVGIAPQFTMTPRWQLRQLPRLQQCGVRSCGRPTATGR
jgi:zinc transporter, ZIP family